MHYQKTVLTKDGKECLLRGATGEDAEAVWDFFFLAHGQTDYLLSYPDECGKDVEQERQFLASRASSDNAIELCAFVDGILVGTAGFSPIGHKCKVRHRAEFGISVERSYWGKGIGRALTNACIECARRVGFLQMELEVVTENLPAISLYESVGFREYGRNPRGFHPKDGRWQELVLMRLELDA